MTNHTIFTKTFQTTSYARQDVLCGICNEWIPRIKATAGPYDADGSLTLICNEHLRNSRQLINLLADYMVDEQKEFLHRKQHSSLINEVVPDAWFLC